MTDKKIIQFMSQRKRTAALSVLLLLAAIISLATNGLKLGLDFTGGTQLEIGFKQPVALKDIRQVLSERNLKNASVVHFGSDSDILIRMQGALKDLAVTDIKQALFAQYGESAKAELVRGNTRDRNAEVLMISGVSDLESASRTIFPFETFGSLDIETTENNQYAVTFKTSLSDIVTKAILKDVESVTGHKPELQRSEFVGPQIGEELRDDGGLGLLFALAVVMAYVAIRFQYKFAVGAVIALIHDVLIVLGLFSLLRMDFDLTVLAAVLAVVGYSLNDTIVVSDRIRENFRIIRKREPQEVIDISLTQTLGRTLITSLTTLLVLLALFFFGGELIHGFATALIIGVVVGTYSSIYVAANTLLFMNITKEDLMLPEKEGEDQEEIVL